VSGTLDGATLRPIGGGNRGQGSVTLRPIGGGNLAPNTAETRLPVLTNPDELNSGTNARTISNVVASGPQALTDDPTNSAWLYVFGQFVDHDLDLEAQDPNQPLSISVPNGDPTLPDGTTIQTGGRAVTDADGNIVNQVAGYLDLSQVYGSDVTTAAALRNPDGTMKTSAGNALPITNGQFTAGDVRVSENPELTALTTLFVREHNFQVAQLKQEHPTWTGDQLYQMARAITTAEYQNITYTEFLPALLGPNGVPAYHGFDPSVSANVSAEFSTAAFRLGHSQISGTQVGIDNQGNQTFSESLAQAFLNTPSQDVSNGIDDLLRNLSSEGSQATDVYAVPELRDLLVAPPDAVDLIAIDIERERDVGLGTLNQTREALGLQRYTSFSQISSDPNVAANLAQVYATPDDVDLFMGGLAEDHVPGSTTGPTFQAILSKQFDNLRSGDQYYWQNQGFSRVDQRTITGTTLSDLLARDANTPELQANVFITAARHPSDVAAEDPNAPQLTIGIDTPGAQISGGPADDTIVAGTGQNQTLTGGGGADTFVFLKAGQHVSITDFDPAQDKIELQLPLRGFRIQQNGSDTLVTDSSAKITLAGVDASTVTRNDFIFAGNSF